MQYVIGIDGGGTKTAAIVTDVQGCPITHKEGGATNPHAVTLTGAIDNLAMLLQKLFSESGLIPDMCIGICMGIAGVSTAEEQQRFLAALLADERMRRLNLQSDRLPVYVKSDAEIALMAALGQGAGTIVIAGTGAIVYGITPDGQQYRAGGWGHILGDKGSGYEIGLQTLQEVMLSYDGVHSPTHLTELVLKKHQFESPEDLRTYIYDPAIQKQHIAGYASICIQAARSGDEAAQRIIIGAAKQLAQLTVAMRRKDAWLEHAPIAVTGSIFTHSSLFLETFKQYLNTSMTSEPLLSIVVSEEQPAWGAAKFALEHHAAN